MMNLLLYLEAFLKFQVLAMQQINKSILWQFACHSIWMLRFLSCILNFLLDFDILQEEIESLYDEESRLDDEIM